MCKVNLTGPQTSPEFQTLIPELMRRFVQAFLNSEEQMLQETYFSAINPAMLLLEYGHKDT